MITINVKSCASRPRIVKMAKLDKITRVKRKKKPFTFNVIAKSERKRTFLVEIIPCLVSCDQMPRAALPWPLMMLGGLIEPV